MTKKTIALESNHPNPRQITTLKRVFNKSPILKVETPITLGANDHLKAFNIA